MVSVGDMETPAPALSRIRRRPTRGRPFIPGPGSVRLRTLVNIHWFALGGQAVTLLIVHYGLGLKLPIWLALGIVAVSAVINVMMSLRGRGAMRLQESDAVAYLAFDLVQLFALLYLTGGLKNPFSVLILAPVTVSASILSIRSTLWLGGLAALAFTTLALWHQPLPLPANEMGGSSIYVFGLWVALVLATVFIAVYTSWVASEARRMSDALSATQIALSREQQLSALGGLAAALAHELGSPLSTIAVTGREIARSLEPDSPLFEDAQVLLSQAERCRDILTKLAQHPEEHGRRLFDRLRIGLVVEAAARPFHREGVEVVFDAGPADAATADSRGGQEPSIAPGPEVLHGLGALIQNAIQFAERRVVITTRWADEEVSVLIRDDGPGFNPATLDWLGEPYISNRKASGEHMGLGVFIAQTLLARTGAEIVFRNAARSDAGDRGALVQIDWPRDILEEYGSASEPLGAGSAPRAERTQA